jgi:hypothetical protein
MTAIPCVILESPFSAPTPEAKAENIYYAKMAMHDAIMHGEAPYLSHLLYTLVLDDDDPEQRAMGLALAHAWLQRADYMVVYVDRGVSQGMTLAIALATKLGKPIHHRLLYNS